MKLDPGKYQFHLPVRKRTLENLSLWNRNHGLLILEPGVNMRSMMAAVVHEVHGNNDAIKHGNGRHCDDP
jgi:hypothetical protein